jgi:hypothetical protein
VTRQALEAALDDRRALLARDVFHYSSGARNTVRIVGPFFTGSALSIRLALEQWRQRNNNDTTFVRLVSGSATGVGNLVVFGSRGDAVTRAPHMSYHATVNSDSAILEAMRKVIIDSVTGLGIPAEHIALLQETSTLYGQQVGQQGPVRIGDTATSVRLQGDTDKPKPDSKRARRSGDETGQMLAIPYPMTISSLRTEYAKHPAAPTSPGDFPQEAVPRIPLPLYNSNQDFESPTPISQLTPASIDLMIAEITRTLKSQDIRAIGLIGTDVRDKIFLADQLRQQLPDVQLFTFGSNDLYLREEYNNALRGMLVFSTYPLVLQNQWWARPRPLHRRRLAFSSDDAEGVFNATLIELGEGRLREYRPPLDSTSEYPPVWVTAVGRHSFIPIRAFSSSPADEYLEPRPKGSRDTAPLDTGKLAPEDHIAPSDQIAWLVFFALAMTLSVVVVRDDMNRRSHLSERDSGLPGRRALTAAVLLHREVYTFLRHIALLCIFAAVAVILVPRVTDYPDLGWASPAAYGALGLLTIVAIGNTAFQFQSMWPDWGRAYWDYVLRPARKSPERDVARDGHLFQGMERERRVWRRQTLVVAIAAIIGLFYAAQVVLLIADASGLPLVEKTLFIHRAAQLDSGVSPIFPIVVSSVALALLSTWQLSRLALLNDMTAFEEAFRWSSVGVSRTDAGVNTSEIGKGLQAVRRQLSRIVPELPAVSSGVGIALLGGVTLALWMNFERSFEAITIARRLLGMTPLDVVLRLSILMIFAASAWSLIRLVIVWRAFRSILGALGASSIITAFERLPRRIARLTRLTLFGDPSCKVVLSVSATQWAHLRRLFDDDRVAFDVLGPRDFAVVHSLMAKHVAVETREQTRSSFMSGLELRQLLRVIEGLWALEPAETQVASVLHDLKEDAHFDGASTSGRIRRSFPDSVRLWVRGAEELVAVQAVEYFAWVLRHLRRLVLVLLFLLLVMMALLSSYSFQPQSVVRSLFLVLFVGAVVSLLLMLFQINRDEVLSRVTRTDPGRLNWSSGFLINVGVVILIPALSLLSAFSPLRPDLMGWVDFVMRLVSRH